MVLLPLLVRRCLHLTKSPTPLCGRRLAQICPFLRNAWSPLEAVHKGRPKRGGGLVKCGNMRTGCFRCDGSLVGSVPLGAKDLADVRKLVIFSIVSACFADTPYG